MSPPVSVCLSHRENSEKNLQGTAGEVSSLESALFRILDLGNGDSGFPGGSAGKESTCNAGDPGSIPGLGRSAGEGKGYPLQYSGLENSLDCIVHGVTKSQTRLSDLHFHFQWRLCSWTLLGIQVTSLGVK